MGKTVDLVALPARVAEVEESTDVVILIKGAEEPLGLLASQAKAAEGHGFPVGARQPQIFLNNFAKIQIGRASCRERV